MAEGALSRLKILDLTWVRAGPACVRQFADHSAEVIKIETPGVGDGGLGGPRHGLDFQNLHRNKRCLTLDLKALAGWISLSNSWACRRAGGKLPARPEGPPRHRLCRDAVGQPASGLRQHFRFR